MRLGEALNRHITTSLERLPVRNFISMMRELVHYLQPESLRIRSNTKADKEFYIELIMVFHSRSAPTILNSSLLTHLKQKLKLKLSVTPSGFLVMSMIRKNSTIRIMLYSISLNKSGHPLKVVIFTTTEEKLISSELSNRSNQERSLLNPNQ